MMQRTLSMVLCLLALLTGCSESPTGRRQLLLYPEESLATMGAQAFAEARTRSIPLADEQLNRYINCVASRLIQRQDGNWELAVFRDEANLNAFALPGNKIVIYTGLLQAAREPAQLAAVVGHEIGHVLAQHANERASEQIATETGLRLFYEIWSGGSGAQPSENARVLLGMGASVGILLPFSRAHEIEADQIGQRLMAEAGFDPRQSISLWENMAAASQKAGGKDGSLEFLSTHPSHASRAQLLLQHMPEAMRLYESSLKKEPPPDCANVQQRPTPLEKPVAAPPKTACCGDWQWW